MPTVWVDADACPRAAAEIVVRAADKGKIETRFVAGRPIRLVETDFVKRVIVPAGVDAADDALADLVQPGDLALTDDVPLAARLVERGAVVLSFRGVVLTDATVGERLSSRDFLAGLREAGVEVPGARSYGERERAAFAAAFNSQLQRLVRRGR